MDKITYTPGRLARKLGLSKGKLMNHLRETGLIKECFASKTGRWQIPYDVAVKISSVETLALSTTQSTQSTKGESKNHKPSCEARSKQPGVGALRGHDNGMLYQQQTKNILPNYAQIGKILSSAGITMMDVIKHIEQQMEVTHEQSPYNSAKRDEDQTDEPKSSGSTGSDISNSSEK